MIDLDHATALLGRTPRILDAWLRGLPDAWLDTREAPDTFSPRDVLGHLLLGERTDWMPRLRLIRSVGESRAFEPFDRFAFRDAIRGRAIDTALDEFAALRRANLQELESYALDATSLAARGRHPAFGPVTTGQLLATWVAHDLDHLAQIARVMARRYETAVGPWKEDLGVLSWKGGA